MFEEDKLDYVEEEVEEQEHDSNDSKEMKRGGENMEEWRLKS